MEGAEERRERLKRLREEAQPAGEQAKQPANTPEASEKTPSVKFRNYKPRDEKMAAETVRCPPVVGELPVQANTAKLLARESGGDAVLCCRLACMMYGHSRSAACAARRGVCLEAKARAWQSMVSCSAHGRSRNWTRRTQHLLLGRASALPCWCTSIFHVAELNALCMTGGAWQQAHRHSLHASTTQA